MSQLWFLFVALGLTFVGLHLSLKTEPVKTAMAVVATLAFLGAVILSIPGLVKA